jgi:hypothetical protein
VGGAESVGINRHETADERAVRGRDSDPPRPRVMRRDLVRGWRSVDRGAQAGLLSFETDSRCCFCGAKGVAKSSATQKASGRRIWWRHGNPANVKFHGREPRDPSPCPFVMASGQAGEGKSVRPSRYGAGESGPIVPMKRAAYSAPEVPPTFRAQHSGFWILDLSQSVSFDNLPSLLLEDRFFPACGPIV